MVKNEILTIQIKKTKPKPSIVFNTYWEFAAKRQDVFFERLSTSLPPWSKDPVINTYKFTNAYRVADRVSQYLIKNIIYKGSMNPDELFFRIILFKIFNRIETWEMLEKKIGKISFSNFNFHKYDIALREIKQEQAIYSAAYIMASGKSGYHMPSKHQNHLLMIKEMMKDEMPEKIMAMKRLKDVYISLKKYPSIGNFLAYQLAIDINYSPLINFSEMDFVKAGPGALDGIKKCFTSLGDYTPEDTIQMMADSQQSNFEKLGLSFKSLWGRPLHLIDCQNLFCEVDKYARMVHPEIDGISGRKRIKQKFSPSSIEPINYFFPPKWNLIPS